MIIYNLTTSVSWAIHSEWLEWVRSEYMQQVLATGLFFEGKILRLLHIDEVEGPTYAIQFHASTISDYQQFVGSGKDKLFNDQARKKWGDQFVNFGSVMEVLH